MQHRRVLSEQESRALLAPYGIPLVPARVVTSAGEAALAADELGYPVALKGVVDQMAHKSEAHLVHLHLGSRPDVERAHGEIATRAGDRLRAVLVQRLLPGQREFVAGLKRDAQFGPCVMFGLGGIFTEVFKDVSFRVAPLSRTDALQMLDELRASALLGAVRGLPAVDRQSLADLLMDLGRIGLERDDVLEIDLNPILFDGVEPQAVDALVVLGGGEAGSA